MAGMVRDLAGPQGFLQQALTRSVIAETGRGIIDGLRSVPTPAPGLTKEVRTAAPRLGVDGELVQLLRAALPWKMPRRRLEAPSRLEPLREPVPQVEEEDPWRSEPSRDLPAQVWPQRRLREDEAGGGSR